MSIIGYYKRLQRIENIKKLKEMELCYKSNLKLVKKQEQQINKLATCIAEIKEITEEYEELHGFLDCSGDLILQKISECYE